MINHFLQFKYESSLLITAAKCKEVKSETLNWILNQGETHIAQEDKSGNTALVIAVATGQTEKFEELLLACEDKCEPFPLKKQLGLALYEAVTKRHKDIVELLLLANAPMDELYKLNSDKHDKNALDLVLDHGRWDIFHLLIKQGYSLKAKNKRGYTPITIAAQSNKWDIVKSILNEQPSDEKDEAQYGCCLIYAVKHSQKEIIEKLLKFNIESNWNLEGYTVFHYAILNNLIDETENKPSIAQRLIKSETTLNFNSLTIPKTPLQMAAHKSEVKIETFHWLLDRKGIEINAVSNDGGNTALMLAADAGAVDKFKMLMEYKADIGIKREDGKTVLDIAIEKKQDTIVKLLTPPFYRNYKKKINSE